MIFSKEKFTELEGTKEYEHNKGWVNDIEGKEVNEFDKDNIGRCNNYYVCKEWCI